MTDSNPLGVVYASGPRCQCDQEPVREHDRIFPREQDCVRHLGHRISPQVLVGCGSGEEEDEKSGRVLG